MCNRVDQGKCCGCKLCIEVCPNHIFGLNSENEVSVLPDRNTICVQCGHCMAICPTQAIHVKGLSYAHDLPEVPEHGVTYPSFMDFLATRRSVRNFQDTPVPKDVLQKILDAIAFAPFGAAPHKVHVTVIQNRAVIEAALPKIAEFFDNIVTWLNNPFIRFLIKLKNDAETFHTLTHHVYPIAKLGNYRPEYGDSITRNAPVILILHAEKGTEEHTNNALIYATYIILTTHALGLGATMIGLVPAAINKVKEVRTIFRIPDDHEATIAVIIGYPKYKYKRAITRKVQPITWIE